MESKNQRTNHQLTKSRLQGSDIPENGDDEEDQNCLQNISIDVPLIKKQTVPTTMSFSAISPINEQEQHTESILQVKQAIRLRILYTVDKYAICNL